MIYRSYKSLEPRRKELKLTLEDISKRVHISLQFVREIEIGAKPIPLIRLDAIDSAYGFNGDLSRSERFSKAYSLIRCQSDLREFEKVFAVSRWNWKEGEEIR